MRKSRYIKIVQYRNKKRADTELILYPDLKVNNSGGFINELGITDLKVYKKKPECCSKCKSKTVLGLEVLGGKEGILFWICDACDNLHLKYTLKTTKKWLDISRGFWTTPDSWPIPERDFFN